MLIIHILLFFILLFLIPVISKKNKWNVIMNDLNDPIFFTFFISTTIFMIYVFSFKKGDSRIHNATERALIAFMIAYLAHLDLPYGAFFITLFLVYFLDDSKYKNENQENQEVNVLY